MRLRWIDQSQRMHDDGRKCLEAGDYEMALALLEQANRAAPHHVTALLLAKTHFCMGRFDQVVQTAAEQEPVHRHTAGWAVLVTKAAILARTPERLVEILEDGPDSLASGRVQSFLLAAARCGYAVPDCTNLSVAKPQLVEQYIRMINHESWPQIALG